MVKHTKERLTEIQKRRDELLMLLKRAELKYDDLIEHAKTDFIAGNMDLLVPSDAKKFNLLQF